MTAQEVFDTVVTHAKTQKVQAVSEDGYDCLYRTPEGLKCFAGALIPDDKYDPEIEGKGFSIIRERFPDLEPHTSLIERLQSIHDSCDYDTFLTPEISKKFKEVAEVYDLDASLVDW